MDLADFAGFQVCHGSSMLESHSECHSFDFSSDDKVNLPDFAEFSALFGGP